MDDRVWLDLDIYYAGWSVDEMRKRGKWSRALRFVAGWTERLWIELEDKADKNFQAWLHQEWVKWSPAGCKAHREAPALRDITWNIVLNWEQIGRTSAIENALNDVINRRKEIMCHCGIIDIKRRSTEGKYLLAVWDSEERPGQEPLAFPGVVDLRSSSNGKWRLRKIIWECGNPTGILLEKAFLTTHLEDAPEPCRSNWTNPRCGGLAGHRCDLRHQDKADEALWKVIHLLGIDTDLFSSRAHRATRPEPRFWGTQETGPRDLDCIGNALDLDWKGRRAFIHPPVGKKLRTEQIDPKIRQALEEDRQSLFLTLGRACDINGSSNGRPLASKRGLILAVISDDQDSWVVGKCRALAELLQDWAGCRLSDWLIRRKRAEEGKEALDHKLREEREDNLELEKIRRAARVIEAAEDEQRDSKIAYLRSLLALETKRRKKKNTTEFNELLDLASKYPEKKGRKPRHKRTNQLNKKILSRVGGSSLKNTSTFA
jgi:hypothetical protein